MVAVGSRTIGEFEASNRFVHAVRNQIIKYIFSMIHYIVRTIVFFFLFFTNEFVILAKNTVHPVWSELRNLQSLVQWFSRISYLYMLNIWYKKRKFILNHFLSYVRFLDVHTSVPASGFLKSASGYGSFHSRR